MKSSSEGDDSCCVFISCNASIQQVCYRAPSPFVATVEIYALTREIWQSKQSTLFLLDAFQTFLFFLDLAFRNINQNSTAQNDNHSNKL